MAKESEEEKAQKYVNELHEKHVDAGYQWLNRDVADTYRKKALMLGTSPKDVGARRQLRIELQQTYGLQEIESLNILNGYNVNDYILKYYRIEHKIPTLRIRPSKDDWSDENDDDWS